VRAENPSTKLDPSAHKCFLREHSELPLQDERLRRYRRQYANGFARDGLARVSRKVTTAAAAENTGSTQRHGLVSTEWLESHLEEVVILDIRGRVGKQRASDENTHSINADNNNNHDDDTIVPLTRTEYVAKHDAYLEAHIPGAQFVDWTRDIADDRSGGLYNVLPHDEFCAAMERVGVSLDRRVVIYDDGDMLFATRLWWCLSMYGHPDVTVLNGGMRRWTAEQRPVSDVTPCTLTVYSEFMPDTSAITASLRVNASDVLNVLHQNEPLLATLVDARSSLQFSGKERRAARRGRIPGAVNVPYKLLVDSERGGFRDDSHIRKVFQDAGVCAVDDGDQSVVLKRAKVIAYCNGGVASTCVLFALHCILGVPASSIANYDGSWNEWGNFAHQQQHGGEGASPPVYPVEH